MIFGLTLDAFSYYCLKANANFPCYKCFICPCDKINNFTLTLKNVVKTSMIFLLSVSCRKKNPASSSDKKQDFLQQCHWQFFFENMQAFQMFRKIFFILRFVEKPKFRRIFTMNYITYNYYLLQVKLQYREALRSNSSFYDI